MDLRRLEYFLAVVEHGRVTTAAAALHVAQPSLSQAIRALESDLGTELFVRDGRGLRPTRAGRDLIEPARRVLRDLAIARTAVDDVVDLTAGWLDLASHELLTRDPLVAILTAFHRRFAGVPVRLREPRDEDDVIRLLTNGQCELALVYLPFPVSGLTVTPVGEQEVWAILPAGEPAPDPLPVKELHGVAFVDSMRGFAEPRGAVAAALREQGVLIRPVVRSRHRESVVPLVVAGVGASFTTERYAREAERYGAQARRLDPPVMVQYALVHRDVPLSPAAREFVRFIDGEAVSELPRP